MMTKMKDIEFPSVSYEEWQQQAIKALKGKPFESLLTKTIEGITLQPFYSKETLLKQLDQQLEKQVATIRTTKASEKFKIAQQIYGETAQRFFEHIEESTARGNELLTIYSAMPFEWTNETLTKLARYMEKYPFKLIVNNNEDVLLQVFTKIADSKQRDAIGYVIANSKIELINFPNVRTLCAHTVPFHNNGANAVQELAIALAQASRFVKEAKNYQQFVNGFFVTFAIDTQFFMEIAKLRAFKILWKAFCGGIGEEVTPVPIVAENSIRSFSKLDVYVNLLRSGNAAFSAIIGGIDTLTVHPHDCLTKPTEQSIRIARNTLLVIEEESHVVNVVDPAGGAYFVETLTADLVKKAWELFLQIEDAGGLDSYNMDEAIEDIYKERMQQVQTRKTSLIGTNIYANPADVVPVEVNNQFAEAKRLALPFEQIRQSYKSLQGKLAILTFGELKNFKARADFVAGIFATAGMTIAQSGAITSVEEAKNWLQQAVYDYIVVVATDEDTTMLVPQLLTVKKQHQLLDVAGRFAEQEKWLELGLNGTIFAGQNIINKLYDVQANLKEEK